MPRPRTVATAALALILAVPAAMAAEQAPVTLHGLAPDGGDLVLDPGEMTFDRGAMESLGTLPHDPMAQAAPPSNSMKSGPVASVDPGSMANRSIVAGASAKSLATTFGNVENRASGPWENPTFLASLIRQARDMAVKGPGTSTDGAMRGWATEMANGLATMTPSIDQGIARMLDKPVPTAVPSLPKGAHRDVPDTGFPVRVADPGTSSTLSPGDPCGFVRGGTIEVMGVDPSLGTLVRYLPPVGEDPRPTPSPAPGSCPKDTLAFVSNTEVGAWPALGDVAARDKALGEIAKVASDRITKAPHASN